MPNWKKVIVSGSDASLNTVFANSVTASIVSGSAFTGSLFGTASWAQNVISASFASTASFLLGSVENAISASYAATASQAQSAFDILVYVKNSTGVQIDKGRVVRISGSVGDNALIATASYTDDNNSANTLGITYQNIPHDSFGYVITEGTLLGIDTSAFVAGQLLYLGATGSITGSAPVAPLHAVRLGEVLRVQVNNGSMYVRIDNGYELGELHDVRDLTTTGSFGDLLVKSGSIWINSKQLTGSYGLTGSLQATSFTGSLLGTASFANNATSASFAATASSADNFTVRGTLTATTIVVQTITASQETVTGSTKFGTLSSNTHQFTGSVSISGSLTVTGSVRATNFTGSLLGTSSFANNATSASFANTASFATSASLAQTASFVQNAVSASFALTSSFVNILRQDVTISGSFTVFTGSAVEFQVTNTGTKIGNLITEL